MKYPRTLHLPWSPGATDDDRILESVEHLVGEEIVITEKLDGENTGMVRAGVYARSHAAFTVSPWSTQVRMLHSRISRDIEEDQYLFGENMEGIHSLEYNGLVSPFYLFGSRKGEEWAPWDAVEETAYLIGIPTVPVLWRGVCSSVPELKDLVESLVREPSRLGCEEMEGCVVRKRSAFQENAFSVSLAKWVRKDHVTTDQHWQRNWRRAKISW